MVSPRCPHIIPGDFQNQEKSDPYEQQQILRNFLGVRISTKLKYFATQIIYLESPDHGL